MNKIPQKTNKTINKKTYANDLPVQLITVSTKEQRNVLRKY